MNGTQFLVCEDGVNLLSKNVNITTKNESLLAVSKEVCLEVNSAASKNMFMSREQKAGQNRNTKQGNTSSDHVQN